jgi:hypothetical protein
MSAEDKAEEIFFAVDALLPKETNWDTARALSVLFVDMMAKESDSGEYWLAVQTEIRQLPRQ